MATRTTTRKTTKTSTTATTPTPAPAEASDMAKPTVVTDKPVVAGPVLSKKDYIDRVVERSGGKKRDVKPTVEAALAVLAEAIGSGEELNLPPLGKLKVNREKDMAKAKVFICKLRQSKQMLEANDIEPKDPLADPAE